MKDKEFKLEEIEVSHTLGGSGEGLVQGRGKWRGFTKLSQTMLLCSITHYSHVVAQKKRTRKKRKKPKDLSGRSVWAPHVQRE
jgi:hypothetical protein